MGEVEAVGLWISDHEEGELLAKLDTLWGGKGGRGTGEGQEGGIGKGTHTWSNLESLTEGTY